MIGTALLVSLAVWLVVVLASRLSVRRSTSSGRGRGLAAAQVFFSLLGMVAANPSEAHESHRPAVLALAGEGTASAIGNPLARLDGPLDRPQGSLEVRRAGYALSENYGYDGRVRPVVARPVSEPAIVVSSGERLGSGVPRSAKSKPLNYDAMTLLRVSHSSVATNASGAAAIGSGVELTEAGVPKVIYRQGTPSPSNLTPRAVDAGDLSFRDSLSNPVGTGQPPVMNPGKDFIGIDTSKLPPGSVIYDNVPPGHVTVRGVTPEQLRAAVVERGKLPK